MLLVNFHNLFHMLFGFFKASTYIVALLCTIFYDKMYVGCILQGSRSTHRICTCILPNLYFCMKHTLEQIAKGGFCDHY